MEETFIISAAHAINKYLWHKDQEISQEPSCVLL